jgi:hypothetical protein
MLIKQHDIDSFFNSGAYVLSIRVLRGRNQITLNHEILGLSEEAAKQFSKQGISKNSIVILKELKKAGEKLENQRRVIQNEFMFRSGGLQFIHEKDLPDVWNAILELNSERDAALEELRDGGYEAGLKDFSNRMMTTLEAVHGMTPESYGKISKVLTEATKVYPSIETVEKSFRIEVVGPFLIKSVKQLAEEDAQLADNLSKKFEAEAIAKFKAEQAKNIEEQLTQALISARSEILNVIAEELTKLDDMGDSLPSKFQKKFTGILTKFKRLSEVDSTLNDLVSEMTELNEHLKDTQSTDFKESLSSFKASVSLLKEEVESAEVTSSDSMIF